MKAERAKTNGTRADARRAKNATPRPALLELLRVRDFRLLWIGQGIARLGDQFYFTALPWLVLQLTGDAFAMGMVLAVGSIPRTLFMLVGGAPTDRFSSRTVMLVSDILRLGLVSLLTGFVLTGSIELWMLYMFALSFGEVDAFFYPALNAMVPQLVHKEELQAGNALVQGTGQLALFAGPVAAGSLIALLDGRAPLAGAARTVPDLLGIGIAFGFNALTFLVSVITLWMMQSNQSKEKVEEAGQAATVWSSIREGLVYMWKDMTLRTFFFITAGITFLINGPFGVGVPVLADMRFPEGAAAFGIIMSAFGGGSLLGTVLAGVLPKPVPQRLGTTLLMVISAMGVGLALLGLISSTFAAALVAFAMGAANGYVIILFVTWLQSRTLQAMLGRMMSLLMFALVGLNPVSTALAGVLSQLNVTVLLVSAGSLMSVIVWLSLFNPTVRAMEPERRQDTEATDAQVQEG